MNLLAYLWNTFIFNILQTSLVSRLYIIFKMMRLFITVPKLPVFKTQLMLICINYICIYTSVVFHHAMSGCHVSQTKAGQTLSANGWVTSTVRGGKKD